MLEGRREFSTIRYILGGRGISIVLIVPGVIPQPLGFLPRKTRRSSRANLFPEYPSHFFCSSINRTRTSYLKFHRS